MKVAKQKVWKTEDGKLLVEDGNNGAAFLVAAKGQHVPDNYVKQFDNGDDFFEDINLAKDHSVNIPATGTETSPGSTNRPSAKENKEKPEKVTTKSSKGASE